MFPTMSKLTRIPRDDWALALQPRPARPEEAGLLSELAFRSKAYWGYDAEFLEACRGELTLTADFIETNEVRLLDNGERAIGFYSLVPWKSDVELGHFFVDPEYVRRGLGLVLWNDAVPRAVVLGYRRLIIESDPNAEAFYTRLGAERIGEVPSRALTGRSLPLLSYPLR
jgi:GNAT superfamily N-acetyltransferase